VDSGQLGELTAAAAAGDRGALERLLAHYLPDLRAFVRLRSDEALRRRESSSDLVQSVCREVLEHADRFQHADDEAFRRWLFTTALRTIRDRRDFHLADKRDARREVNAADSAGDRALLERYSGFCTPSRAAGAREELERVERALDTLSEEHRTVISLSRVAGLSHAAIAAELGRSEGAVRMLLHRALAQLVAEVDRKRESP
jgi:RNA polymerase sigma-70 factor (ECF subfamily)